MEIVGDLVTTPELDSEISRLWTEAARERPHLFDGPVLSVIEMAENRLKLARASYRHLLAARRSPAVALSLKLRPLAVTGVLSCPQGLVFGCRGSDVTQASHCWELAPSGGVPPPSQGSSPDIAGQILEELEQEVGLKASDVTVLPPAGLIESSESGVIDIVVPLITPLSADRIIERHRERASNEYAALRICPPQDPQLEELPLLAETRAIIAALSGSTAGMWQFPTRSPA